MAAYIVSLVTIACTASISTAAFAADLAPALPFFPLTYDEIRDITGFSKELIIRLTDTYLLESAEGFDEGLEYSTQADMAALMEQMQYLHCIVDPCLYGGRCEVLDISDMVTEWEGEMGIKADDIASSSHSQTAWTMNLEVDWRVDRLRNLLTYVMQIEDANGNDFMFEIIRRNSRLFTRCNCRNGLNLRNLNCNSCLIVEGEFAEIEVLDLGARAISM